jgi:AcrR family transcriptional regulator
LILKEAKALFLSIGLRNTEMKAIAQKVGIGRGTLYRYYQHKEQLAFIVTVDILNDLLNESFSVAIGAELTGYEKLKLFSEKYIDMLINNENIIGYLTEFDRMFEREYPSYPEAESFVKRLNTHFKLISKYIIEGIEDKSIQTDEDPLAFTSVLVNTILGLAQRVLVRKEHIQQEQGISGPLIVRKAGELLLSTIKGPQSE